MKSDTRTENKTVEIYCSSVDSSRESNESNGNGRDFHDEKKNEENRWLEEVFAVRSFGFDVVCRCHLLR